MSSEAQVLAGGEVIELQGGELDGGSRKQKMAAKRNPWLLHVKKWQKAHPSQSWSECLKKSRSSYKKVSGKRSGKRSSHKKRK